MKIDSTLRLNNNIEIPVFGLGVFKSKPGRETQNAVSIALETGYRHIDTAAFYDNEEDVGIAIRNSAIPRENIFISTKVWNEDQGYDKTLKAFDISLKKLGIGYIDLYLVHWPQSGTRKECWKAMEKLYRDGRCRAIGVSNYTIRHIEEMFDYMTVMPAVNQVEFSPYLNQSELYKYCNCKEIAIEAYSPLTRGRKFNSPALQAMSAKYSKSPAQILIKWALQYGMVVIPKSSDENRIRENADIFDFEIAKEDMDIMNNWNENYRVAWDPEKIA